MRQGLLVTADGAEFRGVAAGAEGVTTGEAVFNTAMTGYQEIVTDPSYAGQVVVMTAPHIGNYGANAHDDQSDTVHARGLVTRSMSRVASSWRSEEPFDEYLRSRNVIALSDVDTRRLTRHIRDRGAMPVAIGSQVDSGDLYLRNVDKFSRQFRLEMVYIMRHFVGRPIQVSNRWSHSSPGRV